MAAVFAVENDPTGRERGDCFLPLYIQEKMMTTESFWAAFLAETGLPADTRYESCFHFELTEKWANALLALVLSGQKRATCSSLRSYEIEGEPLPQPGALHIVTDWAGEPRCVIRTTGVTVLPFRDVTYDVCRREGEDDCLESWQANHRRFFTAEGQEMGYTFREDMPVVFEDFEVAWQPQE